MLQKVTPHQAPAPHTTDQTHRSLRLRNLFELIENELKQQPEYGKRTYSDRCISMVKSQLQLARCLAMDAIDFEGKEVA